MKKVLPIVVLVCAILTMNSCGTALKSASDSSIEVDGTVESVMTAPPSEGEVTADSDEAENELASSASSTESNEGNETMQMQITVGDTVYNAILYDNDTAQDFAKLLPMTLTMDELNGNEKYYYLDGSLPNAATKPEKIHAGDLKLFASSCLVLFYQDFSSEYTYTDIGYLENPTALAEALGGGNVEITFALK